MKYKRILSFSLVILLINTLPVSATSINNYTLKRKGSVNWYGLNGSEAIGGAVFEPPKLVRFIYGAADSQGVSYNQSYLTRSVRNQHGFSIYYYGVLGWNADAQLPKGDPISGKNIYYEYQMPENSRWVEPPSQSMMCYDYRMAGGESVWRNFKPCGTLPNYYGSYQSYRYTGMQTLGAGNDTVYGEYRYLGYSSEGVPVPNPFHPADNPANIGYNPGKYPWQVWLMPGTRKGYVKNCGTKIVTTIYDESTNDYTYGLKLQALRDLIASDSSGMNVYNEYDWAQRLSLQTDPVNDTPVFIGCYQNGSDYTEVVGVNKVNAKDLIMTEVRVIDDNGTPYDKNDDVLVGKGTRNMDSGAVNYTYKGDIQQLRSYRVETDVYNPSKNPTKLNPAKVNLQKRSGSNPPLTPNESGTWSVNKISGSIPAKTVATFAYNYYVQEHEIGKWVIHSRIDLNHNIAGDNDNKNNDNISLNFNIVEDVDANKRDLVADKIIIKENTNDGYKTVTNMNLPGDYEVWYKYNYVGETYYERRKITDDDGTGSPVYERYQPTFEIVGNGGITQEIGPAQTHTSMINTRAFKENDPNNTKITISKGDSIYFKSNAYPYVRPWVETEFSILNNATTGGYKKINSNTNNDAVIDGHKEVYDLSITSAKAYPTSIMPRDLEEMEVALEYTINYDIPAGANQNIAQLVNTSVYFDFDESGKKIKYTFEDIVVPGENKFVRKIKTDKRTDDRPDYIVPDSVSIPIDISVNGDGNVYEYKSTGSFGNNTKTFTGNDTITLNKYDPNIIANNKSIVRDVNVREITTNKIEKEIAYGGQRDNYEFYFKTSSENDSLNYSESFKIDKVQFKSKVTEDKKLGTNGDGWIDLEGSDKAEIKAGYGFQLRVVTKFNSNLDLSSYGNESNISTHQVKPAVPADIIVEFDNNEYNATGINSGEKVFDRSIKKANGSIITNPSDAEYNTTYTFETPIDKKVYVDEGMKNGKVKIKIKTPVITGTSYGFDTKLLGDSKEYDIHIIGSYLDDVNEHLEN